MKEEDIRWKQRFQNYEKSLNYLEDALSIINPDIIQKAGIIQFFEMTFELAWNTMKDYLEEQGLLNINSPRDAIKKAFEIELISDGHLWLKALEDRNLTSHTYDEETATEVENLIRNNYYHLLKDFSNAMKQKQN
jgi:nucleotidyltransferase substrate binding protein (TIGR01987 family)